MSNHSRNPFHVGGLLRHDSRVYLERGPEKQALDLLGRMDWFTINEPHQCGKTSFISWLRNQKQLLDAGYIFASVGINVLPDEADLTGAIWYRKLYRSLLTEITGTSDYAEIWPTESRQRRAISYVRSSYLFHSESQWPSVPMGADSWRDFLYYLAEHATRAQRRLVIILDNIKQTHLQHIWISGCFSILREMFDSREYNQKIRNISFVLVGSYNAHNLISYSTDSYFEVQSIHLPDFSQELVQELVRELATYLRLPEKEMIPLITQRIYYWSAGHPYLTQLLCYRLVDWSVQTQSFITEQDVDNIVVQLNASPPAHFTALLAALKEPEQKRLLEQLLRGDELKSPILNPTHEHLRLMGLINIDYERKCTIRNRIYKEFLKTALENSEVGEYINIYISCARTEKDRTLLGELETHLSMLRREPDIILWDKRSIGPGINRTQAIATYVSQAHLILFLVSPDFLASNECYEEMEIATKRKDAREARIIPLLMRHAASWKRSPVGKLAPLPADGRPVSDRTDREKVLCDIAEQIQLVVEEIRRDLS